MSDTQEFMGAHQLIDRLAAQCGSREMAIGLLRRRGHMHEDSEELTEAGKARDALTAEERAVERASRRSGKPKTRYTYNPKTNTATLGYPASTPKPLPRRPR